MKYLILFVIRLYWLLIPKGKRKKCIFKKSCSVYVFEIAKNQGFWKGLEAFSFRYNNCRPGLEIFKNPHTNETLALLPSKEIIQGSEIAERLLIK